VLRTTALTLGLVLVAAISARAQQTAPAASARENAVVIVYPVSLVNATLVHAGALTREEADGVMRKLSDSVTRIQMRPMVKIG
jgi:hypothetical protein